MRTKCNRLIWIAWFIFYTVLIIFLPTHLSSNFITQSLSMTQSVWRCLFAIMVYSISQKLWFLEQKWESINDVGFYNPVPP